MHLSLSTAATGGNTSLDKSEREFIFIRNLAFGHVRFFSRKPPSLEKILGELRRGRTDIRFCRYQLPLYFYVFDLVRYERPNLDVL
jgi:hypothetical protein